MTKDILRSAIAAVIGIVVAFGLIWIAQYAGREISPDVYDPASGEVLIPVGSTIALVIGWFIGIFSGSVVVENIFGLNGVGKLYIASLNDKDFEVVLLLQMFYVIISLLGNLVIDIAYGIADPRVRVNK